mmetsp:Transcript_56815/g.176730  ORF Transcript_56815/g.176730 Transcript_56815/m.176730 type:complete len:202 (+) Transcript_56815:54-659(+)
MARPSTAACGRRPLRGSALLGPLLLLCLGGAALAFAAGGSRSLSQRPRAPVLRSATTEDKKAAPAKGPKEDEEEVAARTRGVFMSLDTEEFGLDSEEEAKIPEPQEETVIDKLGDGAASLGAVAVFTAILLGVTFFVFFTKQAEENFYYSGMRDRTSRFGPEEVGMDFREFDSTATEGFKTLQDKKEVQSVPNEKLELPAP